MRLPLRLVLAALLLVLLGPALRAQNTVTVSGVVVEAATGEPLIGASVLVKGTTKGAVTGLDGDSTLVASSIGFEDYTMVASQNVKDLKIMLETSSEFLKEVVVVGYGTVKKENLTGAVDQVSSEVFEGRPVANATQMLQGVVPNLNIELIDGKPGRSADDNIRGATSIGAGGSALILIDGVEGDPSLRTPPRPRSTDPGLPTAWSSSRPRTPTSAPRPRSTTPAASP